jgi:hypothetical protein
MTLGTVDLALSAVYSALLVVLLVLSYRWVSRRRTRH